MAQSVTRRPRIGATRYAKPSKAAIPSAVYLEDTAGNAWVFWFDTSGNLRTTDAVTYEGTSFNFNTGGTVVGTQS
jgi:hypothetical protein